MANNAIVGSQAEVVGIEGDGSNAAARVGSQGAVVGIEGDGTNAQARVGSQAIMIGVELTTAPMRVRGFFLGSGMVSISGSGNVHGAFG